MTTVLSFSGQLLILCREPDEKKKFVIYAKCYTFLPLDAFCDKSMERAKPVFFNQSLGLARKNTRILVRGHCCSEKGAVFQERSSGNVRRQIPVHIFAPNEATGAALSSKYVSRGGEFKFGEHHSDITQSAQFQLPGIQSRVAFTNRLIARERNYLMDYRRAIFHGPI